MNINLMNNLERDISYRLCSRNDGRIGMHATLRDCYHDIVLDVVVNEETLTIEEVSAEFRKSPTTECFHAVEQLQRLNGVVIGRGLNKRVAEAMGGEEGCGNLRNLLLGLLPLAINAKAAAGFSDETAMMENIRKQMKGSCAGYPQGND